LLTYQRAAKNDSLFLTAQNLDNLNKKIPVKNETLRLPARSADFSWLFSIDNTYNWRFNTRILSDKAWQGILFGSLGLFFLLIFVSSLIKPVERQSWVWQLASCIMLVLLTTRFFLYWRYKSFPPYEGMDLPSWQQLTSFSNFGIIVVASVLLGLIFGFPAIRYGYDLGQETISVCRTKTYEHTASVIQHPASSIQNPASSIQHPASSIQHPSASSIIQQLVSSVQQLVSKRSWFFASWFLLLVITALVAAIKKF
jgi:hypothetical protein